MYDIVLSMEQTKEKMKVDQYADTAEVYGVVGNLEKAFEVIDRFRKINTTGQLFLYLSQVSTNFI